MENARRSDRSWTPGSGCKVNLPNSYSANDPVNFNLNDFVETWFDTGAGRHMGGPQLLYGKVIQAGPKAATIIWESGLRNRIKQDHHGVKQARDLPEAIKAMQKVSDYARYR